METSPVENPQTTAAQKPDPQELVTAIYIGDMDRIKDLLAQSADPDAVSALGSSPALVAIMNGKTNQKIEILKLLISYGADMEIRRKKYEWTPLMQAANNDCVDVVSLLLGHGVNIDKKDKDGLTALDIAEKNNHYEIAD